MRIQNYKYLCIEYRLYNIVSTNEGHNAYHIKSTGPLPSGQKIQFINIESTLTTINVDSMFCAHWVVVGVHHGGVRLCVQLPIWMQTWLPVLVRVPICLYVTPQVTAMKQAVSYSQGQVQKEQQIALFPILTRLWNYGNSPRCRTKINVQIQHQHLL